MVRCPARAAPLPVPHRARVSVYDAVYTCRVHRRTPAQAGEHADKTSATTTTQNAGALPTTARRLALYAYTHSPRQPRGAEAVEPSPWRPGEPCAGRKLERPSPSVVLVFAWRPARFLGAWRHPGRPDLRQEVAIECICNDHHCLGLHVFGVQPHAGPTCDPVRGGPRSPCRPLVGTPHDSQSLHASFPRCEGACASPRGSWDGRRHDQGPAPRQDTPGVLSPPLGGYVRLTRLGGSYELVRCPGDLGRRIPRYAGYSVAGAPFPVG